MSVVDLRTVVFTDDRDFVRKEFGDVVEFRGRGRN